MNTRISLDFSYEAVKIILEEQLFQNTVTFICRDKFSNSQDACFF